MELNDDHNDFFRDEIRSYEMDHSSQVWASLDQQLEKKANERYKAVIFRLRVVIGILLLILGSFSAYFFSTSKSSEEQKVSASSNQRRKIKMEHATSSSDRGMKDFDSPEPAKLVAGHLLQADNLAKKTAPAPRVTSVLNIPVLIHIDGQTKEAALSAVAVNNTVQGIALKIDSVGISLPIENSSSLEVSGNINIPDLVTLLDNPDSVRKNGLTSRLSVVAYFAPDLTMKYLKGSYSPSARNEGDYNNSETADFSFNTGLLLGYDINKNWNIKIGGVFATTSQTIKPKFIYAKTGSDGLAHYQFNTAYGTSELPRNQNAAPAPGDSLNINSNSTQSIQVIGVPIIAKYQIAKNRFSYYAQLGLSLNFLTGEKLIVEISNKEETIRKLEGLNELYLEGIAGLGIAYNPTRKLSLLFEPVLRGALTPINSNAEITTYPYSFGLALGLGWHF